MAGSAVKLRFHFLPLTKLAAFGAQIGPPDDLSGKGRSRLTHLDGPFDGLVHAFTAIFIGPSARPWMNCST